jgi:hypothetical protein
VFGTHPEVPFQLVFIAGAAGGAIFANEAYHKIPAPFSEGVCAL